MADGYNDLIVEVARRSGINEFPQNANRITRMAIRYLENRLRLEEMIGSGEAIANEDGRVEIGNSHILSFRYVTADNRYLAQLPFLLNDAIGFTYTRGDDYIISTEAEKNHEYQYWVGIKNPAVTDSAGYDLMSFDYDMFFHAVLYHALRDANKYDEAGPVAETLIGMIESEMTRSAVDKYSASSLFYGRARRYTP